MEDFMVGRHGEGTNLARRVATYCRQAEDYVEGEIEQELDAISADIVGRLGAAGIDLELHEGEVLEEAAGRGGEPHLVACRDLAMDIAAGIVDLRRDSDDSTLREAAKEVAASQVLTEDDKTSYLLTLKELIGEDQFAAITG